MTIHPAWPSSVTFTIPVRSYLRQSEYVRTYGRKLESNGSRIHNNNCEPKGGEEEEQQQRSLRTKMVGGQGTRQIRVHITVPLLDQTNHLCNGTITPHG